MEEIKVPKHWISDETERTSLAFNFWFQREVEPHNKLIREALRVTGSVRGTLVTQAFGQVLATHDTHRAYLIGMEPIAKSPRQMISEIVDLCEGDNELAQFAIDAFKAIPDEPIVKETKAEACERLLRDWLKCAPLAKMSRNEVQIFTEAKAVLEEK